MTLTAAAICLLLWIAEAGWGLPVGAETALQADALRAGAWWQPFTYAVVHGSLPHLTVNLFVLLLTGAALERVAGSGRFAALLALAAPAGAVGFLLTLLFDPRLAEATRCVGASALSTALLGAVAALAPREKITLWIAVVPVPFRAGLLLPLLLLLLTAEALFLSALTAYGAHAGGLLAGLLFGRSLRNTVTRIR